MARRLDAGPILAAIGAALLLTSLFLDWYEPGLSAWTVFEVIDLLLAGLAVAGLVGAAGHLRWDLPVRDLSLPVIGAAALVLVVSQLLNHPPAAYDNHPDTGIWLALSGSALLLVGAILSVASVSLAVSFAPKQDADPPAPEEAAAAEPEVQDELYPEPERAGPIGQDDPETLRAGPDDETVEDTDMQPPR